MWFFQPVTQICSALSHRGREHENSCDLLLLHWNISYFTMVFLIVRVWACVCASVCECVCVCSRGVKHSQCAHLNHQDDLVRRPWRRLQEAFLFMWGAAAVRLRSAWICSTLNPQPLKWRRCSFCGKQEWSPSGSPHVVRERGLWKAPFSTRVCTEYFFYKVRKIACVSITVSLHWHAPKKTP